MSKSQAIGEATKVAAGLHPLERKAVPHLHVTGTLSGLAEASGLQPVEAMRALQWLEGKKCLTLETRGAASVTLTKKGVEAAKTGLPEEHALKALQEKKFLSLKELSNTLPAYDKGATGVVVGNLKARGVPFITNKDGERGFTWVEGITVKASATKEALARIAKAGGSMTYNEKDAGMKALLKRQGYATLEKQKEKEYTLTPLGKALTETKQVATAYAERVTPADLRTGAWQKKEYRPYNVSINVPAKSGGRTHFVNEAIEYIKGIWRDLGFTEMEGDHVQTSFWDLDALFVPQDHPAREMQDTFYLANPAKGTLPKQLLTAVKAAHEHGGKTGSTGWQRTYDEKIAKQNLLRTHTTVLSAQYLDKIRRGELTLPAKLFSVATVYRNEALDWKHLFEFHQVDCIVVDENATLQHLKGYLREFFGKMGYPDVRIRPAHFPYTEPSVEVDVYDPKRKEWVELGGAGIFRPEVTKTLLGKEIPVLAWGLGMERIIKEYYKISDIRTLYHNDIPTLQATKAWLKHG